jgi:glycosyltransferase involved in cell wall biosynthesis
LITNNNSSQCNPKICLVSFTIQEAFVVPFSNLLKILQTISNDIYYVVGKNSSNFNINSNLEKQRAVEIYHRPEKYLFMRIFRYAAIHVVITLALIKMNKLVDTIIFFKEDQSLLSMAALKVLSKKIIWMLPSQIATTTGGKGMKSRLGSLLRLLCFHLTDRIIVYSPNLVAEWKLTKFQNKIRIAHEHFIDLERFTIQKSVAERRNTVAFVGRWSEEKGILNFIHAIPEVLKSDPDIIFRIGGSGPLKTEVEQYLEQNKLKKSVEIIGWIAHDKLPEFLNDVKLLVLPSYTEGLPNIMLEAMACGVPVLATRVGTIPDIIKDGQTGFILENNSSETIASNILKALSYEKFNSIAENVRFYVKKEFIFSNTASGINIIFNELNKNANIISRIAN